MMLRPPRLDELEMLSSLCLRSKAVWGYDQAFLDACREELTIQPEELETTKIAIAERDGRPVGVVQLGINDGDADLLMLFVDPDCLGCGIGRSLVRWAIEQARAAGANRITIDADPGAVPFYVRIGARQIGTAPSESIPGRMLPLLALDL